VRSTSIVASATVLAISGPLATLAVSAPASDADAKAGHAVVDLRGARTVSLFSESTVDVVLRATTAREGHLRGLTGARRVPFLP
jgi:hypothetical protein